MSKVAVVTGTSGNLGPIWVETLNKLGYTVFGIDLPKYDVSSLKSVAIAARECVQNIGSPEVIVNNAAVDNPPGSDASFFGNFERIMAVNLTGAINVTRCFLPDMILNQKGLIVNIGSIQGNIGADYRNYPEDFEKPVAYNCSKAALIQLSRSIAVQYGRFNIRSVTLSFSAYDGGKLKPDFLGKFLKNVPLRRTISRESLEASLIYAINCPELTGQQILCDAGYCAW
jgi:NAD(P)-dependent dehydrogenase (short-subunit alcohol dehydrogenase family)